VLIDSHLHLDFDKFDSDRDEVVERAVESGVTCMITIGTDLNTSEAAINLAERYDCIYAAVGLHPTEARQFDQQTVPKLRQMAQHKRVVAIGEVGLDYYWKETPVDVQHTVYRSMIQLSADLDLPLVIHNRESDRDVVNLLGEESARTGGATLRGVMHCFSGDATMLQESVDLGFYISLAGNVTYKKSTLPALVGEIPHDRLLVETDAPFLAPVPKRGKRNEPAFTVHTATYVAKLMQRDYESVANQTTKNALRLFKRLENQEGMVSQ